MFVAYIYLKYRTSICWCLRHFCPVSIELARDLFASKGLVLYGNRIQEEIYDPEFSKIYRQTFEYAACMVDDQHQ